MVIKLGHGFDSRNSPGLDDFSTLCRWIKIRGIKAAATILSLASDWPRCSFGLRPHIKVVVLNVKDLWFTGNVKLLRWTRFSRWTCVADKTAVATHCTGETDVGEFPASVEVVLGIFFEGTVVITFSENVEVTTFTTINCFNRDTAFSRHSDGLWLVSRIFPCQCQEYMIPEKKRGRKLVLSFLVTLVR